MTMPFTRASILAPGQRRIGLLLTILLLGAASSGAAELEEASRELWSGHYQCGPIGTGDEFGAYRAAITLTVENSQASITKESARIRETFTGRVAPDGQVVLDGTGKYKADAGTNWRYRFEGTFKGRTFQATGAMVGPKGTKLRDCSMTLTQVSPPQREAAPAAHSSVGDAQVTGSSEERSPQPVELAAAAPQIAPQPLLEDSGSSAHTQSNATGDIEPRSDAKAGAEIPQAPPQDDAKLGVALLLLAFGVVAAAFVTRGRWTPRLADGSTQLRSRPRPPAVPGAGAHNGSAFAAAASNGMRRLFARFPDIDWRRSGVYALVYTIAAIGCWMIITATR